MAQLRDLPFITRTTGAFTFAKRVWAEVMDDNLFTWASALAYSWLFAVFPFFIFLMTLLPYLPGNMKAGARHQLAVGVYWLGPSAAADTVWNNVQPKLDELLEQPRGGLLSIGLLLTLWAASGGMAMTMTALDRCYDVARPRPWYRQRPLAVLLTAIFATFIIVVMVLLPVGTLVTKWLLSESHLSAVGGVSGSTLWRLVLWEIGRYTLALTLLFVGVAFIYRFGPNYRQRFRILTPGSVFTVAVWILLGVAFRYYVGHFADYSKTYGTVGGVVMLLFFFYLDALVLLIGAEINAEVDCVMRDSACERDTSAPADTPTEPTTPTTP